MPRPRDDTPLPPHTAIVRGPYLGEYLGKKRMMTEIRCPRCLETRERTASETRREARRPNYSGYCRPCSFAAIQAGEHRWKQSSRAPKTSTTKHRNGYVLIPASMVAEADLPLYRSMQRSGQPVLEHRLNMAKHLGRPLTSNELVDHMDGNKKNNDPKNLRLYIRGKQQPGSAPGHGTYYHEWQTALRKIAVLEARIYNLEHQ